VIPAWSRIVNALLPIRRSRTALPLLVELLELNKVMYAFFSAPVVSVISGSFKKDSFSLPCSRSSPGITNRNSPVSPLIVSVILATFDRGAVEELELATAELVAVELVAAELGATELGATELAAVELGAKELAAVELGATELTATELGVPGLRGAGWSKPPPHAQSKLLRLNTIMA
jgi:hypothetical protein